MAAVAARGEGTRRALRGTQSRLERATFSASRLRFASMRGGGRGGGCGGGRGDGRGDGRLHCGEAGRAANA